MPYVNKCPTLAIQLADYLNKLIGALKENEEKCESGVVGFWIAGIIIMFWVQAKVLENLGSIVLNNTWSSVCIMFLVKAFFELDVTFISSKFIRTLM
jgi:hypothetical protein